MFLRRYGSAASRSLVYLTVVTFSCVLYSLFFSKSFFNRINMYSNEKGGGGRITGPGLIIPVEFFSYLKIQSVFPKYKVFTPLSLWGFQGTL